MARHTRRRTAWPARALTALAVLAGLGAPARAQDERPVQLELVLALDTSSSVSAEEFELQRRGLAEAFRDPDVVAAIRAAGEAGIAVALVQWSGNRMQRRSVGWTLVNDADSAARLAAAIAASRRLFSGSTALGGAIRHALAEIEDNRFEGRRKVIDVSGDGSGGLSPRRERDRALARGVTINGLAILNEDPGLARYYAEHVIGGSAAFVLSARDFEDFARAMREKLIKEITGAGIAARPGATPRAFSFLRRQPTPPPGHPATVSYGWPGGGAGRCESPRERKML